MTRFARLTLQTIDSLRSSEARRDSSAHDRPESTLRLARSTELTLRLNMVRLMSSVDLRLLSTKLGVEVLVRLQLQIVVEQRLRVEVVLLVEEVDVGGQRVVDADAS